VAMLEIVKNERSDPVLRLRVRISPVKRSP
jgi:hypothetical protein